MDQKEPYDPIIMSLLRLPESVVATDPATDDVSGVPWRVCSCCEFDALHLRRQQSAKTNNTITTRTAKRVSIKM